VLFTAARFFFFFFLFLILYVYVYICMPLFGGSSALNVYAAT
jgi:hypothetical protein